MSGKGRILIIDDDELIRSMLNRVLTKDGYDVGIEDGTGDVTSRITTWRPNIVLLDITLPGRSGIEILQDLVARNTAAQVVMLTADDSAETAVKAMKLGAVDYFTKPFNSEEVKIVLRKIMEQAQLGREVDFLRKFHAESFEREIIGKSQAINGLRSTLERMAGARISTLLITGESGTGKEVLARYFHGLLHEHPGGATKPYIAVNCAAVPEQLLESELFGHEKGAFTDAKTRKKGVFELAEGGVILLDEIGDMQPGLQSKLLRVIEERQVRHVGGTENIPLDVTVVATTNKDLAGAVRQGQFRNDLYYRLNSFHITVPPLRERKDDILLMARHFLAHFSQKYNKKIATTFSPGTEELLLRYGWPGNVREIKNCMERVVVLGIEGDAIAEYLPASLREIAPESAQSVTPRFVLPDAGISLEDLERDILIQAIEKSGGNKMQAAKLLKISYDTLRYQVKKFKLE